MSDERLRALIAEMARADRAIDNFSATAEEDARLVELGQMAEQMKAGASAREVVQKWMDRMGFVGHLPRGQ